MSAMIRIAVIGIGKIARDQHIPMIQASDRFDLAAVVSRNNTVAGVPAFATIAALMAALPDTRAIAVCTPPRGRLALVREALAHGLHVMIEKPPAATLSEAEAMVALPRGPAQVLFAAWHSRHAAAVAPARAWLAGRAITSVTIRWKEDVRVWHPGQDWIWEPGIGVFDPGINALSILTAILPRPIMVEAATLRIPRNRAAPIAARLTLRDAGGLMVDADFDFDQRGEQSWDIYVETDGGALHIASGGARLSVAGEALAFPETPEYAGVYARFATLIDSGCGEADLTPFRLVADAFLVARHETVAPFDWVG